jgi:mono/diheme cytochrome c family protein
MTSRMNVKRWIAMPAFLLLIVSIAGCGPAEEQKGAAEEAATPSTTGSAAPPQAATQPKPAENAGGTFPCISGDAKAGQQQYTVFCASCHGAGGNGDGPAAVALNPRPARHTDGDYMNSLTNEHMFKVIELGGGAVGKSPLMAPWGGTLSDQQIWNLVAFVRSLAEPPYACP